MIGYADADSFLTGGRNKDDRPISDIGKSQAIRNTRVVRRGRDIAIRYHETDIITIHPDGSRTLDTGGWLTVSTKTRLNAYLGVEHLHVGSDRGAWYLYRDEPTGEWTRFEAHPEWDYEHRRWNKVCRYFDGITIAADGTILNPRSEVKEERQYKAEHKMGLRIDRYIEGYFAAMEKGKVELPGNGDCWYCGMHVTDGKDKGKAWGEVSHSDHLDVHMKERYYVPSLLWNAVRARGYRDEGRTIMFLRLDNDAWGEGLMKVRRAWNSTLPDTGCRKELRRELRKYLRKRLIPTRAVN
jgi:hypothetical protein